VVEFKKYFWRLPMKYAITTLEIEIARIESALRKARSTTFSYDDSQGGHMPSFMELERDIRILKRAIEVLNEWNDANPDEVRKLEDEWGEVFK
jgi:hypothetical protein